MNRYFSATLSLLLLFFVCCLSAQSATAEEKEKKPKEGNEVGDIAFDFTLNDVNDVSHTLSSYRGKTAVLLVFWYTGCPHCVKEIPDLIKITDNYGEKGMKVLSLNVYDSKDKLKKFIEKNKINYTVLDDSQQKTLTKYKVVGVPENIIVDSEGIIRYRHSRPPSDEIIKKHIPAKKEDEKKDDSKKEDDSKKDGEDKKGDDGKKADDDKKGDGDGSKDNGNKDETKP